MIRSHTLLNPVLAVLAGALALTSCLKEAQNDRQEEREGKQVTIRVCMPEDAYTKVDITAEEHKLSLSWQESDCIRIISGNQSQVFTVSRIISDKEAEFVGEEVTGSSFDILCPGTYASIQEAEADTESPGQDGNASVAHLRYKALLSGVNTYSEIAFNPTWASSHGGSMKSSAALKLALTLPEGVTGLKKATVRIAGTDYTLPLSNVDVSASSQQLTAYMMLPWNDIPLPAGSALAVSVTGTDNEVYSAQLTMKAENTLLGGRLNTIQNVNLSLQDFVGGDGSEENPYLIATARQLGNMMALYRDPAAPANATSFKYYFCLQDDVDITGMAWTPINNSGSFYKAIDFDGGGHTIKGLTSDGTYAGFCGVLYGSIRNVTFDGATISGTTKKGVVAGFLGTTGLPAYCENVVVKNSSVTGSNFSGGFAGHVRTTGTITGCRVENTTVSSTSGHVGGFAAYADITGDDKYEVPARFADCHVVDVTVDQNYEGTTELYTGGFIGGANTGTSFTDCTVKATVSATKAALKDVGGFIGRASYACPTFKGCAVLEGSTVNATGNHAGGFVGYTEVAASYTDCSAAATVLNTSEYSGGFAGYASGASSFNNCSASGNVTSTKHAGGFVGTAENAAFTDCFYTGGTVTENNSGKSQSGGFCGFATTGVSFRGCYVKDAVFVSNGGTYVGGFVGQLGNSYNGGNNITVSQCHVTGTSVTGSTNCGGFVGVQYDHIGSSYVSGGSVTAKGAHCGGFSGFVQNGNLTNCYTTAAVNGASYAQVAGMAGIVYTSNISYCYAAGSVTASGTDIGAFVGQCAQQGEGALADISHCIGWNASLPFCGNNAVEATLTDCYAGTEGTVSDQALAQSWPDAVWDLGGPRPLLLDTPRRINAIFIGDSITWQWARTSNTFAMSKLLIPFDPSYMTQSGDNVTVPFHPGFFTANSYLDKGVSGQNTTQMLARFQRDIVDLNPVVTVIMGGTNDLAQGFSEEQIAANIAAMAEMADAAGIKVVICTVTPCNNSSSKLSNPNTKGAHIITLNGMLQEYAASKGFSWCDYWTPMVAEDGLSLHPDYCLYDYLHPGPAGYDVMEPIIKSIVDSLL